MNVDRNKGSGPEWVVWLAAMRTTFLRDLLRGSKGKKAEIIKAELIRRGAAR